MDDMSAEIADIVLKEFDALPSKRKPQVRGAGVREWVPLSGIVAQGAQGNLIHTRERHEEADDKP